MLAAWRHRVNAARACAGLAPASPQAGVITACSAHVASDSPSRRQSRMTRSAVSRAPAGLAGCSRYAPLAGVLRAPAAPRSRSGRLAQAPPATAPVSSPMPASADSATPVLVPPP